MRQQVGSRQNTVNELDLYYFSVRPKLSQQCLRLLLFGNTDLEKRSTLLDDDPLAWHSDDMNQPIGLFTLASEFDTSLLCAISAT